MLAKIVKSENVAAALKPERIRGFSLLDLGTEGRQPAGIQPFVFPSLSRSAVDELATRGHALDFGSDTDLHSAHEAASRIVAQAESDKSMIEQAAYEKGLNEAMAEVERLASERASAEIDSMRRQLAEALDRIGTMAEAMAERAETDLVKLAVAIAGKVIHREATTDREIVISTARAALSRVHSRSVVEIRLHPNDHDHMRSHQEKLGFRGSIQLVSDPSVSPGGCLVHTENGDVDATIDSQLDEILTGLLGSESEMPIIEPPLEDHSQTIAS